jgi:general secretion pathway protein G
LIVVITIIGVLAAIALPSYQGMRERAQIAAAIGEIRTLQQEITEFQFLNDRFPTSLSEVGSAGGLDPWGRPYAYLDHSGATPAQKRKDRFLVPVNSDYDLYSLGPDGLSRPPFAVPDSRDDIVRANNGGFVGLASAF